IGTGAAPAAGFQQNTVALHGSEPLPPVAVLLAPTRELLGVRFVVLPPGAPSAEPRLQTVYDGADARIVEDPAALPRAFVAARARCVGDREALARLRARAPASEVLLADCAPSAAQSDTATAALTVTASDSRSPVAPETRILVGPEARILVAPEAGILVAPEARILVDEPARVVVAASTESPAWLVLTDTWFPGWRARLDGADVAVSRADHAF